MTFCLLQLGNMPCFPLERQNVMFFDHLFPAKEMLTGNTFLAIQLLPARKRPIAKQYTGTFLDSSLKNKGQEQMMNGYDAKHLY